MQKSPLKIGIIAGEASGDQLGAGLISALKAIYPDIVIEGVAGPKMIEAGCKPLASIDRLSVMGLWEPLAHLPDILKLRHDLIARFKATRPDVVIGIDAPDFNLGLELKLKKLGIKTAHYVSPTIWAWRAGRIHKIKRAVDLMLTIFPFETKIYDAHQMKSVFVGHPLANQFPIEPDMRGARGRLNLPQDKKIIGLFAGSRKHEVGKLSEHFIRTALWCLERQPDLHFVTSFVNEKRRAQFEAVLSCVAPNLPITMFDQESHDALEASDAVLLASGTITLEALLLKKPMVVTYKVSPITYCLLKPLMKTKYFAMPNVIAGEEIVPELLQGDVSPKVLGPLLLDDIVNEETARKQKERFIEIHQLLRRNANEMAAKAVLDLIAEKRENNLKN